MSKLSQAKSLNGTAEQLTLFAAEFPANPQAWLESDSEPPMVVGSGLIFCAWCLKSNPCGCWRRILAESLVLMLEDYNSANGLRVSLRLEVTNSYPSSWLLRMSARRTNGKESGSWPTVQRADAKRVSEFRLESLAKRPLESGRANGWNLAEEIAAEFDAYLTPNYSEWMMGFPLDWTLIE